MAGHTPIVSFVARSGTGKTTFLERLIAELVSRGIRVMALKHDVHGFEVDRPGKDTWRLKQAGARRVLIANSERLALIGDVDGEQSLLSLVDRYADEVDLVLTEGYRRSGMPKILLARSGAPQPFDPAPEELDGALALLTDHEPGICVELPRLALDDPGPCADLLVERFLGAQTLRRRLTGVVLAGGRAVGCRRRACGRTCGWLSVR